MLITLFTDAGYRPDLKRGTWAAWYKAEGQTFRRSGILRSEILYSADAELMAIANAFYYIRRDLKPSGKDKIILQTDCMEAIAAIKAGNHIRPKAREAVITINSLWTAAEFSLDMRHVNGHKGTATPRNAVNTWCDKECQRKMKELVKSLAKAEANDDDFGAIEAEAEAEELQRRYYPCEDPTP